MIEFQLNTKYTLDGWPLEQYIEVQSLDSIDVTDEDGNPLYLAKLYHNYSLNTEKVVFIGRDYKQNYITLVSPSMGWKLYNEPSSHSKIDNMSTSTKKASRLNSRWSASEIEKLVTNAAKGYSYNTLAELLGRTPMAVSCKLSEIKCSAKKSAKAEISPKTGEIKTVSVKGSSVSESVKPGMKASSNNTMIMMKMLEEHSSNATVEIVKGQIKTIKFHE